MKVLLVHDVEKLGRTGEVKEVAGGFGRNYLIPKGFAVLATPGRVRQAEERIRGQKRRTDAARRDAEALAQRIQGVTLRFAVHAGEQGRLYGSVTSAEIAAKLGSQIGIEIDRRKLDMDEPLKRTGIYPMKMKLMAGLEPVFNVVVEAEGTETLPDSVTASSGTEDDSLLNAKISI